ncbi:MCE family protein [Lusitaniella coriacea LEGE 07157]|uniref:MCE family protein n=1 Tax=Lusitaniella coriacea LEGE 07157 TaxID=945747 RepID=A0A8J7IUK4_9CYAN|nr:MlaD family protein [Lusitaniella coriacea]MBE9117677.1 MCE family protein [Lusitaniella coriacea LEGE 07157]
MRSRTLREGSVGLLILIGLGLFGIITVWLRGIEFGQKNYQLAIEFANANGMSIGSPVRYRGVNVGKIVNIEPGTNGVKVIVEISPVDLLIPKNATIQANQSGLLNQASVDITPLQPLSQSALAESPIGKDCNPDLIVCENATLQGEAGATIDDLLNSTVRLSEVYASPEFAQNINKLLETVEVTALDVTKLSAELKLLSRSVRGQIPSLSGNLTRGTDTLNTTALSLGQSADRIAGTVDSTALNLNVLSANLNRLIEANGADLGSTLNSVRETSESLDTLLVQLQPTVAGLNTVLQPQEVENLRNSLNILIDNTSVASENLRNASNNLNNPFLALSLQELLNSARETFENARKITAEIDEITGDPEFRNNLRNLVNGLGDLLSSTQELEHHIQLAEALEESRKRVQVLEEQILVQKQQHSKTAPPPPKTPSPIREPQVLQPE